MENKYIGAKEAINESEKVLKEQIGSVETFKIHQSRILTSLSLIITVVGLIFGLQQTPPEVKPWVVLFIGFLFLAFVAIYVFMITPVALEMPIKIDFDVFKKIYLGMPEKQVYENKLTNYIAAINDNRSKINCLLVWSWISSGIYILIIVIAIVSIMIMLA